MSATELISEAIPETEFTAATPLTSDQPAASSALSSTDADSPSQGDLAGQVVLKQQQPPTPQQDTQPQQEIQKESEVFLDDNSTPQVCQQIEIVTEEQSSFDPSLPQIDAVWSIGQEHSYEQRPDKRNEWVDSYDNTDEACQLAEHTEPNNNNNNSFECDKENHTRSIEIQHTPRLLRAENQVQGFVQTHAVQVPKILKIQTKASKKYFIQDLAEPGAKRSKYLALHSSKSHVSVKKTMPVLKLPAPHSLTQPSLSSCLIDHNLKPLQIQHNLENKKSKSKAVLRLETMGLKYQADMAETVRYPISSDPSPCPLKKTSRRGSGADRFILKEVPAGYPHAGEEVGADAVYIDVDANLPPGLDFNGDGQLAGMEGMGEADQSVDSMLDNCSLQSLSMDQYLPDFTDLPQFPNIPLGGEDDAACAEPQYLTPSIPHNVLNDYDWQQCHTSSYSCVSHAATPAIITQPQAAVAATTPSPISLSKFMDGSTQQGGVHSPGEVTAGVAVAAGVDAMVSADVGGGLVTAEPVPSGGSARTLTQLDTVTMMTSAPSTTVVTTMTAIIKTEDQVSFQFECPDFLFLPTHPHSKSHTHTHTLVPNFRIPFLTQ